MNKLHLGVRIGELWSTCYGIVSAFYAFANISDDEYLIQQIEQLEKLVKQLQTSTNAKKIKSDLKTKDDARDKCVRAINSSLKGFSVMPEPSISEPAKRLLDIFNRVGVKVCMLPHGIKSSQIEGLLRQFKSDANQADIKALAGFSAAIQQLDEAQTAFDKSYIALLKAKTDRDLYFTTATKLKEPLFELLNETIVPYLNVMVRKDEEKYGVFARDTKTYIDDSNAAVRRRLKRNAKEEKEGEEGGEGE